MDKSSKVLSAGDWEQVMSDFATSEPLQQKWLTAYPAQALLELALNMVAKEKGVDFSLKQQLLIFLEENGILLIGRDVSAGLGRVLGALKALLINPGSSPAISQTMLSQLISLVAVLAVQLESQESAPGQLEFVVDLLLTVISRVNSLSDRQVRGAACEALRGLERATPCLLHAALGHLLGFCQMERTHVVQSYILLFLEVLEHASVHVFQRGGLPCEAKDQGGRLVTLSEQVTAWVPSYFRSGASPDRGCLKPLQTTPHTRRSSSTGGALLSSVGSITPYSLPPFLSATKPSPGFMKQELTEGVQREFRKAVSFLLESIELLSEPATAEVVSSLIRIVTAIQLPASTFKHHFAGLLHTTSPLLIHTALRVYLHFPEAYSDTNERSALLERLAYLANDLQQPMSARLLSLHWLLALVTCSGKPLESDAIVSQLQSGIFDPLAVKALKAEALSFTRSREDQASVRSQGHPKQTSNPALSGVLTGAGSDLRQAASLEASVAFRTLHRFLASQSDLLLQSESDGVSDSTKASSSRWQPGPVLQQISVHLVTIAADHPAQMSNILSLLDRLFQSKPHAKYADFLLHSLESMLLPRLQASNDLPAYFPLFQEMVTNGQGNPKPLLNLLADYCVKWGQSKGSENGVSSEAWSRGAEVLEVCRHVMLVHPQAEISESLEELLSGLMNTFPDIEVRDSARVYFAFLSNLSQDRLRALLSYGGAGEASESAKLLRNTSVSPSGAPGPARADAASYIQIRRVHEPLGAHSLALDLASDAAQLDSREVWHSETSVTKALKCPKTEQNGSGAESLSQGEEAPPLRSVVTRYRAELERVCKSQRALCIPCFVRYSPQLDESVNAEGLLRLAGSEEQLSSRIYEAEGKYKGTEVRGEEAESAGSAPAIYSVVLSYTTPGHYGPIPSVRLPFLLADAEQGDASTAGIVPPEVVEIEIRPTQPVPALIETRIDFTDDRAQAISDQLQSIPIGIEDLFCEVCVPADAEDPASFRGELFDALWADEEPERTARTSEKAKSESAKGAEAGQLETAQLEGLVQTQSAESEKLDWPQIEEADRALSEQLEWTESVKLLEVEAEVVVEVVEQFLGRFVTGVSGQRLVEIVKQGGVLLDARMDEPPEEVASSIEEATEHSRDNRLQLEWSANEQAGKRSGSGGLLGCFEVLSLLPPKYHLLLKIEISEWSSLAHIRTDFWPCLAYVDEFLENLVDPT